MTLTVVGLPIGNIEDISLRALKVIQETRYLVCEDSRMFNNFWCKLMQRGLVKRFEGKIRFINDFNEYKILPNVLAEIGSMNLDEVVLVSDAGMPLISDPGYKLVRSAVDLGWEVNVVPGPTAESAALAISGLPTDRYLFLGFLPKKGGKKIETLAMLKEMGEKTKLTAVIYESPLRLLKILPDMVEIFGGKTPACLAVDLTKISQKIFRGSLQDLLIEAESEKIKGEVVILVSVGANN